MNEKDFTFIVLYFMMFYNVSTIIPCHWLSVELIESL